MNAIHFEFLIILILIEYARFILFEDHNKIEAYGDYHVKWLIPLKSALIVFVFFEGLGWSLYALTSMWAISK